jgi:hypothetical protein
LAVKMLRSHLKNRILVQGPPLKPRGIKRRGGGSTRPVVYGISDTHLKYAEELKRGPNTEIGPKDLFEIASNKRNLTILEPISKPKVKGGVMMTISKQKLRHIPRIL